MKMPRRGEREAVLAEGIGVPMPMRVSGATAQVARHDTPKRAWWMSVLRVIRNALFVTVAMAMVPLVAVLARGDHLAATIYGWNAGAPSRARIIGGALRQFTAGSDPSITPLQAGQALNALRYRRPENWQFAVNKPVTRVVLPWRITKITPDMFPSARSNLYDGPASPGILGAVPSRFSASEQAYLKTLAEAPVWQTFDLVARAPAVDIAGGQLRLPLPPDVDAGQRPMPSYTETHELALASVSRAAYYLSIGRTQEAEEALRSLISFGFALIDNGTTMMDEQHGAEVVGIGRDALNWFLPMVHDPRWNMTDLSAPVKGALEHASLKVHADVPPEEARRRLVVLVADPEVPRPERFEAVRELTLMQCTSARGILFGQPDEVREAIERARTTLARYPSEQALIELQTRLPSAALVSSWARPLQSLLVSPALVVGAVLRNPRMGACTLMLTSGQ